MKVTADNIADATARAARTSKRLELRDDDLAGWNLVSAHLVFERGACGCAIQADGYAGSCWDACP